MERDEELRRERRQLDGCDFSGRRRAAFLLQHLAQSAQKSQGQLLTQHPPKRVVKDFLNR